MTDPTAATLEQVAALGPFFAFDTHDQDSTTTEPWRPMSELVREPHTLLDRVTSVRAFLAAGSGRQPEAVELRVAASVTHLGLVARLVSPVLAVATLHGLPLSLSLESLRWQPSLGGAFPLSIPREALAREAQIVRRSTGQMAANLLDGPILELVEAARRLSVSRHVLWGNVASAINGAATAIAASAPAWTEHARDVATVLLEQPPLRDTHTRTSGDGRFRRHSCCLIYRAAPDATGALCGDCVLASRR
ncbi:(2Fe-2S)-binding protein [Streptantibioticus ferralitis]|uniref:(2Fe-2S)-binding protein n=1 Tax=Streptantibioticus ferralitis TaxID=236510 RepID=A0ABT5YX50_9ACTN|nr:(2Fe-2S)-binding protein [Streptantibioticus ferralitis]MDF2255977.1 (2Fe-2S)-binding protein [Streptantibioticus ferralitis]